MTDLRFLTATILSAAAFYLLLTLLFSELVVLNASIASNVPWSMVAVCLILWISTATVAKRWCAVPLVSHPGGWLPIVVFIASASICCIAVAVVQGWIFRVEVTALGIGVEAGPALSLTYSAVIPPVAAVVEEVSFRGILQSRLQFRYGWLIGAVVSILTFVLAHSWKPSLASQLGLYIAIGIATTAIVARCGFLLPAVLSHGLGNMVLAIIPIVGGPVHLFALPVEIAMSILIIGVLAFLGACVALVYVRVPKAGNARLGAQVND